MPLKQDVKLPELAENTKAAQIEQVLEKNQDIVDGTLDPEILGRQMLALLVAGIKGEIPLKTEDRRDIRSVAQQLVPSAPKRVELTHTVKPEEYIAKAMENNPEAFDKITARAAEYELEAEKKRKALEEFTTATLHNKQVAVDARESDSQQEGTIFTQEGDS
jgi:hypothetical protein